MLRKKETAYLFAHFTGTEQTPLDEQIYFSVSEDGLVWTDLNKNLPVLISDIGTYGARDPFLLRTKDNRFVIIATDLSVYEYGWQKATTKGSRDMLIWESDNLIDWSGPRAVPLAEEIEHAGCLWAPEALYNEEEGFYMIYFASSSPASKQSDSDSPMNVYITTTKDFKRFETPKLWIYRPQSIIDTSMIKFNGYYYRVSADGEITLEKSKYPIDGSWEYIATLSEIFGCDKHSGSFLEGPELFLMNEADWLLIDEVRIPTFGLLCDQYKEGQGYKFYQCTNVDAKNPEEWRLAWIERNDLIPGVRKKRHGSVLPVTAEEYNRLIETYSTGASSKNASNNKTEL